MYKVRKILCTLLLISVLIGCFSTAAYAGKPEASTLSDKNVLLSSNQSAVVVEKVNSCEKEQIIEVISGTNAAISFSNAINGMNRSAGSCNDRTDIIEDLFGCDIDISNAYQIYDTTTEEFYTRYITKDKTEVSFDENGDIFKISTIYSTDMTNQIVTASSVQNMQDICLDMMPDLYELFGIDTEYALTETYEFDEDYLFFTFEKMLANDITNPFQSINVVFDRNSLVFSVAVRFDSSPNAIMPTISAAEALSMAQNYTSQEVTLDKVELTYISDRMYNTLIDQYNDDICYLVYRVSSTDGNIIIYVDALSGEYVSRDMLMLETGFSVAIQESKNSSADNYNSVLLDYTTAEVRKYNSWFEDKADMAASAMGRLGYNASSNAYSTRQMITDIKNYLSALSNEYAFFFTGHGNTTVLGFHSTGWIRHSDVTGNWHFVFLDACQTATDTGWANAFKINGYSDRAFLGWNGSVAYDDSYLFAEEFWPLINGSNTVRQAAVDAAAMVPGSGSTPIKFYGDTSYTGEAWS